MRGVYCDGRSIRLERNLPEPTVGTDEVLLQVRAAGICDTDLQLARGYMGFQGILGHEFVATDPEGRRVTAEINNACRSCAVCLAGCFGHCPNRTVLGILGHDGAMADRVAVPAANIHVIPDSIEDLDAVFIEPLAAAFRITEQVPLGPDVAFAVVGDGKLGLLCAWVARSRGARVTLIGKHLEKLKLAGEGIETILLDDLRNSRRRFPIVADCTGSPTGLSTALSLVEPLGTVVLKTTIAGEHTLNLAGIVIDEVKVIGSRCGPFPKAIQALAEKTIDVRPLIGEVQPLDNAEEAFRRAGSRGARKVILEL